MKPNFALSLSFEGIDLLYRAPDGWRAVGHASFEDADLSAAITNLRAQAEGLGDDGLTTKLILPENQVKFIEIPLQGLRPSQYRMAAENALDGTTPYPLQDLAIDWQAKGSLLHIAAVAKETLAEAEVFAQEHAFNPVSFTAQSTGDFPGEPFFGPTDAAAQLLGGAVEPDVEVTTVIGPVITPPPAPETPAPIEAISAPAVELMDAPANVTDSAAESATVTEPTQATDYAQMALNIEDELGPAVPLSAEELEIADTADGERQDSETQTVTNGLPPAADLFATAPDGPDDEEIGQTDEAPQNDAATAAQPANGFAFASVRAPREDNNAPALNGVSRDATVFEGVRKLTLRPDQQAAGVAAPAAAPPPAVAEDSDEKSAEAQPTDPLAVAASLAASAADLAMAAEEMPATALAKTNTPQDATADTPASQPDAIANSVFATQDSQQVGGKPRYLGLSLMALLLLGFVGVFGWSFLGENGSGTVALDGNNTPEAAENISESSEVESPLPAVEGTAISAAPDTSEVTDLPPELQYEPEAPADNTAESAPETPDTSDTSGATVDISSAERYAASGIWQEAPQTPAAPQTTALDDLYIASIDPSVSAFDAVALPDANRVRSDITPPAQSLPAAAGTTFSFDQRGLVTATAEGALTPDGILIFAGPPPLRPRNLPERTSPAATTTGAISPEELSRRAKVRPKARPEGLIEENERSQLGGRTRNELADLRPKLRPENLAATVALANAGAANNLDLLNSASQPLVDLSGETRDAINDAVASSVGATSLKPKLRPKNLDTSVATGTQVASAARSQPQLPSSASVARQATVKNQLNLRKVNLIGVTGKSGARKALVRMKNGRVKTVSVGDRLDGGRVKAIDKDALHYTRSGRTVVLKMPKG